MATEGTAVQYLAVQLVEAPNPRARMALVGEVSPLVENLIGGMEHCPIADDPMFLEIWKSCDKAQRFMDYFTHWFYQQEAYLRGGGEAVLDGLFEKVGHLPVCFVYRRLSSSF